MTVLVIAQVVMRYAMNDPLTWSEEMSRILFIYLAYLGIGAAYGRRRHMFVDAVVAPLPEKMKRIFEFGVVILSSAFLIAIIFITFRSIADLHRMDITTPALEYPMALVYLVIPVGLAGLIAQMWIGLRKPRRP